MDVTAAGHLLFGEESEQGQDFNNDLMLFVSSSQIVFKKASNRMLGLNGSFSLEHILSEHGRLKCDKHNCTYTRCLIL